MMDAVGAVLGSLALLAGAFFALMGALGLVRFPDVYTRMHAASKAGTLGSGFCLLAVAASVADVGVSMRAIVAILFFMITAPVSAHLLARAAFRAGYPADCRENAYLAEVDREKAAQLAGSTKEDPRM